MDKEEQYRNYLLELGQDHIVEELSKRTESEKQKLFDQLDFLDTVYPGGMRAYVKKST